MTQFLKNNAKILYITLGILGFLVVVFACVFITPYTQAAVNYNSDVLNGIRDYTTIKNENLLMFCSDSRVAFKFSEIYPILFQFDRKLQAANNMYLYMGVVTLIMLAIMLICSNMSRKKYYISNLVSGIVCPAVVIIMGIVSIVTSIAPLTYLSEHFDTINWGALGNVTNYAHAADLYANGDKSEFIISNTAIVLFCVLIAVVIVVAALLIAYTVYRYKLTQKEINNTEKVVEQSA